MLYTQTYAAGRDAADELADFRGRFRLPDENLIYLDGNSLGPLPLVTVERMAQVIEHEWGQRLIRGWNDGWYTRSQRIAEKLAPLVGARPDELVLADSTSVNLFKLAYAALALQEGRTEILSDESNFPSDLYLLQGLISIFRHQHRLRLIESPDEIVVPFAAVKAAIHDQTSLVCLSHVAFKSGFVHDVPQITRAAHDRGALTLWDLSHSVGALPVQLDAWDVDLAVGCTYKYLNGGPGSLAFLFVRTDLQERLTSPIWGWFGQRSPFEFGLEYQSAPGIRRFLVGTPPVLSLSALEPALDLCLEAGVDRIRRKNMALTEYFVTLCREVLAPLRYRLGSPPEPHQRGSHVTVRHEEAYRICQALVNPVADAPAIIADYREPDNLRLGFHALYTRYVDVYRAVVRLEEIARCHEYQRFSTTRASVT
ncbi:MAG: kynureninase [Pirellulaceae bacterium]|nr:kynureninase [Pirellulaceae bacterium]